MVNVDYERARRNMVEQQVRVWEVLDDRVLNVIDGLPRERFVPESYRGLAYADLQVPIGQGEVMMEPRLEARLLQALGPSSGEVALEIGTGTGYVTAALARLAGEVVSVDRSNAFCEAAGERLAALGVRNARIECGDAARGWDDGRRYDAIAVTGSLPELHQGFHRSLSIGGRLFVIVGEPPIMEGLLITRVGESQWATESLLDTRVPPLVGAPRTKRFSL